MSRCGARAGYGDIAPTFRGPDIGTSGVGFTPPPDWKDHANVPELVVELQQRSARIQNLEAQLIAARRTPAELAA